MRGANAADNCTGNIGKLPAVITKSGVWCMKKSLAKSNYTTPNASCIDVNDSNLGF